MKTEDRISKRRWMRGLIWVLCLSMVAPPSVLAQMVSGQVVGEQGTRPSPEGALPSQRPPAAQPEGKEPGKRAEKQEAKEEEKKTEEREAPPGKEEEAQSPIESFFLQGLQDERSFAVSQFGYSLFQSRAAVFQSPASALVGPDYVLGPGDGFTVTIWGMVDGHYQVRVNREGMVVFPRVGEVPVVGVSYGELKAYLQRVFARHYKNFQLNVTIEQLRGIQVFIVGEVHEPGSYTLSSLSTAFNALFASGGPTKAGTLRDIQVLRNGQVVKHLDLYEFLLKGDKSQDLRLQDQDTVFVPLIGPTVAVTGHVQRPAIYEIKEPASLGDLLTLAGEVRPTGYLARVQIERIVTHDRRVAVDFNLAAPQPGQLEAVPDQMTEALGLRTPVQNMDMVKVFPINPLMQEVVYLKGHVVRPGPYELKPGMRVTDIVKASADLLPEPFLEYARLIRLTTPERATQVVSFNLGKALAGDPSENLELQSLDEIEVYSEAGGSVMVEGEVKLPGRYSIRRGERLSSVLKKAAGFTVWAFPRGIILIRESVRREQQAEIQRFVSFQKQRILAESAALSFGAVKPEQAPTEQVTLATQLQLLDQLATVPAPGRVVVKVTSLEQIEGTPDDVRLEPGDQITVPQQSAVVTVLGAVRNGTSLVYREGLRVEDYVQQAGGLTPEASKSEVHIVRADGSTEAAWARFRDVGPGDTIVVPATIESKIRPLPFWQAITSIIGNTALAIAGVAVIGRR